MFERIKTKIYQFIKEDNQRFTFLVTGRIKQLNQQRSWNRTSDTFFTSVNNLLKFVFVMHDNKYYVNNRKSSRNKRIRNTNTKIANGIRHPRAQIFDKNLISFVNMGTNVYFFRIVNKRNKELFEKFLFFR